MKEERKQQGKDVSLQREGKISFFIEYACVSLKYM